MCFQSHKCKVIFVKSLIILITVSFSVVCVRALRNDLQDESKEPRQTYSFGDCRLVLDKQCPDEDVKFFLYTKMFPDHPEPIQVGHTPQESNITNSRFNKSLPTKIIIHGYNSDMFLGALVEIRNQYFVEHSYNIIAVDWSVLCPGPCYPTAVYNTRHVGKCMAQLVNAIRDLGDENIHIIGFSLGAHVANFLANELRPYKLPRITGLDPAMPGFTFVTKENKLDAGDAKFVDVMHTNAFIQGTIESSGHVDFYMNGGIVQPGCWAENRFFACNHHRAPLYFAESITTTKGFWGWPCSNYFMYLIGQCPPKEPQVLAGQYINRTARGMHLVITGSVSPFAVGKFTGPSIEIFRKEKQRLFNMQKSKDFAKIQFKTDKTTDDSYYSILQHL